MDGGNDFVRRKCSPEEFEQEVQQSDVVMLTYLGGHIGTSGLLTQAAAWGRPVIATSAGWIGYTVRKWGLGTTVDAGTPAVTAAMMEAATGAH